ncbi:MULTISPECIES: hypothetical protein [Eubacterium]|uniref:Uncharacterized protein n=1 Tax=Eubacterium limosum TaxID=1736 RepID=A0ABT5UPJ2_EUBLI|nr:hypothetical protein [Eubacterium limosum]MCB6569167.1 hypothetical protein [Eubacterium limosum]MDE1470866.1 hypothetical protein [Eubacterium limosum]
MAEGSVNAITKIFTDGLASMNPEILIVLAAAAGISFLFLLYDVVWKGVRKSKKG